MRNVEISILINNYRILAAHYPAAAKEQLRFVDQKMIQLAEIASAYVVELQRKAN